MKYILFQLFIRYIILYDQNYDAFFYLRVLGNCLKVEPMTIKTIYINVMIDIYLMEFKSVVIALVHSNPHA